MVNWCPESQSAVSDLEVEMQEVNGHLWHFKYPLISESGEQLDKYLEVATTRPETLWVILLWQLILMMIDIKNLLVSK